MAPASRPPNLLVIMPDQLRATALGIYGNRQTRQPHLAALAASGAMYRYAFTPYPVCVPARVAFWTGRWPHLTGSRTNTIYLQPDETHLLQPLRERNYATALIGKNHCFTAAQMERYFDVSYPVGHGGPADDGGDPDVAAARRWVRRMERDEPGKVRRAGAGGGSAYAAGISPFPVEKHGTWLIGEHADHFIRGHATANPDQPFCAWVSIPDPHTPYQVSEPYASLYPPESLQLPPAEPPGYPGKPDRVRLFAELMQSHDVPDDHLRFVLSIYYGMIAVIDDVVGRLMHTLDELGLRDDTIVVFTADHGDYATEHRLVRKGASMYDCLTRIPLLVSYPRAIAAGTVSEDLVSTLDVFPTLCRLMDVPIPPGRSGQPLPQVAGVAGGPARNAVFSEMGIEGAAATREDALSRLAAFAAAGRPHRMPFQLIANSKLKMLRTHDWKYVHQAGGEHELYDLRNDPHELINLVDAPEHQHRVHDFQRQLLDWTITTEDTLPLPDPTVQAADRAV